MDKTSLKHTVYAIRRGIVIAEITPQTTIMVDVKTFIFFAFIGAGNVCGKILGRNGPITLREMCW